jgi:hypothetical protein
VVTDEGAAPNRAMPTFGHAYSDIEIAAVANYVTARVGLPQFAGPRETEGQQFQSGDRLRLALKIVDSAKQGAELLEVCDIYA